MADRTEIREALTFDDVLLQPGYSEVMPAEVDVQSQLTKTITLRTPILAGNPRLFGRLLPWLHGRSLANDYYLSIDDIGELL